MTVARGAQIPIKKVLLHNLFFLLFLSLLVQANLRRLMFPLISELRA